MKGIHAGSFDPITLGHISVIQRAASLFQEIHVVVANNRDKNHRFSIAQRTEMAELSLSHVGNVIVVPFEGIVADYINANKIDVVIRGIRNSTDLEYETQLEHYIRSTTAAETVYLSPYTQYLQTSSSLVRMFVNSGKIEMARSFMHDAAYAKMVSYK